MSVLGHLSGTVRTPDSLTGTTVPTPRTGGSGGVSALDDLTGRPSYNGSAMTHETSIPQVKTETWDGKQDAINDLSDIRSGAALGATAVQPSAIADMATKTWTLAQGFITSLAGYATEAWVLAKGYYVKAVTGIPKTDLASAVQTSLDLADSALQSVPDTYRTAAAQDVIDATKVDKVDGKGLSTEDFTTAEKTKLSGIAAGAEVNVQSDWNQSDNTADDYIKNKPSIPAAQVNSDWNAVSGVAQILNKPSIPSTANDISYNSSESYAAGSVGAEVSSLKITKVNQQQSASDVGKVMKVGADGMLSPQAESGGEMKIKLAGTAQTPDTDGYVNIPKISYGSFGIVKHGGNLNGIGFTGNGEPYCYSATQTSLLNRQYIYMPLTVENFDFAVKVAMCDEIGTKPNTTNPKNIAWTDSEKTGAWSRLNSIKTSMDAVAVAGAQYFLGEQTAVAIVLPSSGMLTGQQISVVFYSGATAATLSITGTTIGDVPTPTTNQRVEVNMLWDGTYWSIVSNVLAVTA